MFRVPCVSTHHTDAIFEVDKWLIRAGVRHRSARKAFVEKSLVGTMGVVSVMGLKEDVDHDDGDDTEDVDAGKMVDRRTAEK